METKMNEASNQPLKSGHTVECRICLQMVQNRMFTDVFAPWIPFSSHDETTVAAELANIAGIEIPENDNQQYICKKCTSRLSSALQFIVEVRQSDQILKQRELETQNLKEKWPKPIQLEKNINEEIRGNTMDVEIKEEVKSDDELEVHEDGVHDGDSIESVSIKVEPEDTVDEEPSFQITVNGTVTEDQYEQISMTNGYEVYENEEYLENQVKEEPVSEEEGDEIHTDLPLECMLCAKTFQTVSGLKAHVIAQHNYKTVKRKSDDSSSPSKKRLSAEDKSTRHVCVTCRRSFSTSTDLRVHEVCHDKFCCFACNAKFNSFGEVTHHRRRCKAKVQVVKPKTLDDAVRERAQAVPDIEIDENSKEHLQCFKCKVSFKDIFYLKLHNAIHIEKDNLKTKIQNDIENKEKETLEAIEKQNQENYKYAQIENELESIFDCGDEKKIDLETRVKETEYNQSNVDEIFDSPKVKAFLETEEMKEMNSKNDVETERASEKTDTVILRENETNSSKDNLEISESVIEKTAQSIETKGTQDSREVSQCETEKVTRLEAEEVKEIEDSVATRIEDRVPIEEEKSNQIAQEEDFKKETELKEDKEEHRTEQTVTEQSFDQEMKVENEIPNIETHTLAENNENVVHSREFDSKLISNENNSENVIVKTGKDDLEAALVDCLEDS